MIKTHMKKMLSVVLCLVLIAAMALCMTGCGGSETPETTAAVEASFTFIVVDAEGNETTFDITTDKATVGEALLQEGLIEGEESEYGLYVKTVNGITADYDVDQTYWAFYIDGEYATTGVDATDVVAGSTYTFKVEGGAEEEAMASASVGVGATSFTFTVVDVEGVETVFTVNTDETTVGAALLAVELIDGEMGDYGLYVKTVNGITLDWDKDQKYWAFYVDGEYAMTGVDSTEIAAGSTYTFKAE